MQGNQMFTLADPSSISKKWLWIDPSSRQRSVVCGQKNERPHQRIYFVLHGFSISSPSRSKNSSESVCIPWIIAQFRWSKNRNARPMGLLQTANTVEKCLWSETKAYNYCQGQAIAWRVHTIAKNMFGEIRAQVNDMPDKWSAYAIACF